MKASPGWALGLLAAVSFAGSALARMYLSWSHPGDETVSWFCSALGLALLVVGAACLVSQSPPAQIPWPLALLIYVVATGVLMVGIHVDSRSSGPPLESVAEIVGFAVILGALFLGPRLLRPPPGRDSS